MYFPDFTKVLLSSKSGADGDPLSESDCICTSDRERKRDRCLLRNRNDRSDRIGTKEVVGVELNKDAVKDAILNAKENQIRNVRFFQGDAGEFMEAMAAEGNSMDVLFMDPPRAGSDEKFMASAVKMGPEKIVYISCNPETLARDLKYLTKKGYQVKKIQPVEMFAFTEHVETVVLLSR